VVVAVLVASHRRHDGNAQAGTTSAGHLAFTTCMQAITTHPPRSHLGPTATSVSQPPSTVPHRYDSYDSEGLTNQYINLPEVRTALGVRPDASAGDSHCSAAVREAMAGDVMRSVVDLLPGIIAAMPVLLFQGQFDAQDGPASNSIWINSLEWPSRDEFAALEGELWEAEGRKAGWWRRLGNLTHAVVRNAGHMVPHDQPAAGKWLVQTWAEGVLGGGRGGGRGERRGG
jgi:carboxypeptidase C (cathepsin A)